MNNKIFAAIALAALAAAPLAADAGSKHDDRRADYRHDHDRHDRDNYRGRARVVHVDPIYERVRYSVPVEQCWDERVRRDRRVSSTGAAIAGGAAGAIIGNRVSDGKGLGTVVGAIAGAAIGNSLGKNGDVRESRRGYERHCEVRHEERFDRRVVAYWVTYEHRGRRDVARLNHDPGRYVDIADVRRRG